MKEDKDPLLSAIQSGRDDYFKKHGTYYGSKSTRIYKIPRYDWSKDLDNLKENGLNPYDRCSHCGWRYRYDKEADPYAAFCIVCSFALATDDFESSSYRRTLIEKRLRIEGTEPVHLIIPDLRKKDGTKIENKNPNHIVVGHLQL